MRALLPAAEDPLVSAGAWGRARCCLGGWSAGGAVEHE